jgi:hypothetical protein
VAFQNQEILLSAAMFNAEGKWIRNYKIAAQTLNYEIDLNGLTNRVFII